MIYPTKKELQEKYPNLAYCACGCGIIARGGPPGCGFETRHVCGGCKKPFMGYCSAPGNRDMCLACAGEGPSKPSCGCKADNPESRVLCLSCPPPETVGLVALPPSLQAPDGEAIIALSVEGGTSTGIESGEGIVVDIIILYIITNLTNLTKTPTSQASRWPPSCLSSPAAVAVGRLCAELVASASTSYVTVSIVAVKCSRHACPP